MVTKARSERGEGRFGAIVGLMVFALTIYVGFKTVPVMVRSYEFRDFLNEQARFAALRKNDADVRKSILKKANDLELPVTARDIRLNRTSNRFDVKVQYTVPIETPVYTYNWVFNESESSPLF